MHVAFRCTALYTIPCAVLFLTTAQPMLQMLFSKGELNGLYSILKVLAITVIFYGLCLYAWQRFVCCRALL